MSFVSLFTFACLRMRIHIFKDNQEMGINLQGYCTNDDCLAAKAKLPIWVNLGFGDVSFTSDKTAFCCPDCGKSTVTSVAKAMIFNSEHSISASDDSVPVRDNHYQCFYTIKPGLIYELKAKQIRQHATSLEELITKIENAMVSTELINLIAELQKHLITVVKPLKVKDRARLLEKIQFDDADDRTQAFDVGRFTILCDNATKLQTAVAIIKKAEKFNLIVSEDNDLFDKQSSTHDRFHSIKIYVPKYDVYVEMQVTLKKFTTLEGFTEIENPNLRNLLYGYIKSWKPDNPEEEDLKQASSDTLTKINDVICEWIDDKGIQKIANRYKSHLDIGVSRPSQLSKKSDEEVNNNMTLKMAQFAYEQLCKFTPEKVKGKRFSAFTEYNKKYIIGDSLKKEDEKVEVGQTRPGVNLQGYCTNGDCLAAKAKLPVWVDIGFGDVSFTSDKTAYCCPDCGKSTVSSIAKTMIFNSEHSIGANDNSLPVRDNHYQCFYTIKPGLTYELKAKKIRQHATNLEDLIHRSEDAMVSNEIINLVAELQKYLITVVKPPKIKDRVRLSEKIQCDYNGDYNQVFDVGRFTILCDNATKLQTAVAVMKKAEKFNLIVSEDKDFFEKQSKTHHRFHNIKLYVPKHDVYVEMQATLKSYTTLEGYTIIENPKLSHLFYEHIRAWTPENEAEEELKQVSDDVLTKINDVICEWIDDKGIQKIASRYKSHLEIGILKPPQLSKKSEEDIDNNVSLKMAQFVYKQLCKFAPEKKKGKAIYVILYEYYKNYIIGDKNPASCADFALLLQETRKQEMKEDVAIAQALETYIPLQANSYPHVDGEDNEKNDTFDCHQHVMEFLEKEEKKSEQQEQQRKVMIIQGKSGSGKSIFCRHLEETLWNNYISDSKKHIPVYISFSRIYNKNNEKDIILQALQGKHISKEIIDAIREKVSFVFIMDGFDEIFDFYRKNENEQYFYDRFNLGQWSAKVIVTCRSKVLDEEDIKTILIGINQNQTNTSMMYLWPFTKQQMHNYIEKFAIIKSKNKKQG
ncbi:hypothetical protein RFI_08856 [Reticulomyxa filosa]|uniref:NACHT domain-containing protein n=1 Tax=Reticulomyxa filosa TaxID=46433 RepID=X6NRC0_RETFI|nr:hypothetical protein RFI_08856 [Reticulomyxa filosa]|eukprot:ETO28274.1 hypothetical protein RFI_08856 [Reticulomyxa filosa]